MLMIHPLAGYNKIQSIFEWLKWQTVPSVASHDARPAHGFTLEKRKIFRRIPRNFIVFTDGPIAVSGGDQRNHKWVLTAKTG
jgi:hypothetical protein